MRLLLLSLLLCLVGCSTVATRTKAHPEVFRSLPSRQQQLVLRGEVAEGMNKDAVFLAWGLPQDTVRGSDRGRAYEEWIYETLRTDFASTFQPTYNYYGRYADYDRYSFYGGRDTFYSPYFISTPVPYKTVRFVGGVVDAWRIMPIR